jgi:hypothetical protein
MKSLSHRLSLILSSRVVRFVFLRGRSSTFGKEILLPMASNKYGSLTFYRWAATLC